MRRIISAIIIDKNSQEHDYKSVGCSSIYWGSAFDFDLKILNGSEEILDALNEFRGFDALITVGNDINFEILGNLPFDVRKKWVHFDEFDANSISNSVISTLMYNINRNRKGAELFSVFTSTYNTPKEFLERLHNSLLNQTYRDWEWWIIDDSTNDDTIKILKSFNDYHIHIIKNITCHGNIGYNKHKAAMVCDGDFLVEVDHDDELTPDCLETILKAYRRYPDANFFYSHTMEEMDGVPIDYGDNFALGLGTHENFIINGVEQRICTTPDVNALSLRHIVGLPNHVRCWRKDLYHKIGGHNKEISVLDDMEILLRTFLYGKMCKIDKVLYIQHEGSSSDANGRGSTTQGVRMGEILRLGYFLKNKYDKEIHDKIVSDGYEDVCWNGESSNIDTVPDGLISFSYTYTE